jgi:hypothetical protein
MEKEARANGVRALDETAGVRTETSIHERGGRSSWLLYNARAEACSTVGAGVGAVGAAVIDDGGG